MAYTIIRTNGDTLTTIQDGTINTTSTSLGLPGRNYAGYGQTLNTNFVKIIENFASDTPPANPLKGQLWFNTNNGTLNVCPADGTTSAVSWLTLASTNSGGSATLGNLTVIGNIIGNNASITNAILGDTITVRLATVTEALTASAISGTSGTISSLNTQTITTGSTTTSGSLTGVWTVNGSASGNAFSIITGNISFVGGSTNGIKTDNYMYANGVTFNPSGQYSNSNVSNYLTAVSGGFTGNISPTKVTTSYLAGGGNVSGIWTLTAGARFEATYADLAERFEADAEYDAGTVVEIGGAKEVTAVVEDLSETVFGVVSNTAAMLMNRSAGDNATHPPIAVSGRVPVKVKGQVKKGDRLVSAGRGYARSAAPGELTAFNTIGRALTNKLDENDGTVEAIVMIR
jgi:hypothetical protein